MPFKINYLPHWLCLYTEICCHEEFQVYIVHSHGLMEKLFSSFHFSQERELFCCLLQETIIDSKYLNTILPGCILGICYFLSRVISS